MKPRSPLLTMLTLQLHGTARAVAADGRSLVLRGRAAGLVALAALEPGGVARERAALMLWPDSPNPRQSLRQQLLRFRQALGAPLLQGDPTLTLAAGVLLAAAGDAALLAGEAVGGDDFGLWLQQQRRRQQAERNAPLRQALAVAEQAGDLDAALAHARALLAGSHGHNASDLHDDSDTDEADHAALMRLHYLRGEAAAGLAVYQRLADRLSARVGSLPGAAAQDLAAALRRMGQQPVAVNTAVAAATVTRLPLSLKRPPVMAGRAAEHQAVQVAWAEGRAALIEGEAGMGKSRLIAECLATAPAPVLHAAARPGDSGAPYSALARLLRPVLGAHPAALSAAARDALSRIGGGALHGTSTSTPASSTPSPTPARHLGPGALQAAVADLLDAAAVQTLVLDDLHFADTATLELLSGLAASESPRRWLFAQRPAEAAAAAQSLRSALTELQRLAVVPLAPLGETAAAELVDNLAVPGLHGATLAPALVRHSGGNPLFLLETLKQGLLDGSLARGELPRPASVGTLIELRLQRLSEGALTLARVAAIAGADFSIELAEAATGHSAVQLSSAWQELQDAQVLRDEAMAHDLVADATLRGVPLVVARRVHAQCAQWLAARGVEPARVAWHWRLGGAPAEAGRAFVAAALRAEKAARLHEEAALYEHAAQAFAEADLHEERFEALLGRVRSLNGARFDELALQECQALTTTARTDVQRMRAHSERCGLLTERGEPQAAIEAGQAALARARQLGDHEWQVRTACHMAIALGRLGRTEEAVALLAPLRPWLDAQPDDALRMLWHGDWGAAVGNMGRLGEAVAAYDVALEAARRLGLRDAEGRLLLNCSIALRQSGQLDRALTLSRQGQALSGAEMHDAAELPIDALVLARDEAETGHYSTALASLERVLVVFEQRGTAFWVQACRMVLVRLWLDLGQVARAVPLLRNEAAELPAWLRADSRLLQLELARALHQPASTDLLNEAWALAAQDTQRGPSLKVRTLRSWPPDQVAERAEPLAKTLSTKERHGALLALHVYVARAACVLGHISAAAAAARAAAALLEAGYAPESMYLPEAHLVAWQALTQAHAHAEAAAALRAGTDWIRSRALPEVPAPFLDSFLNRNTVNRELLALV